MTYIPAFTDNDLMPFGKHKDKKMANVPASYLIWLLNNGLEHQGVKKYILINEDALLLEISKQKR